MRSLVPEPLGDLRRQGRTDAATAAGIGSGYGEGGLPVGIQLAARPFEDALLLRVCQAYEKATPWRGMRPAMAA